MNIGFGNNKLKSNRLKPLVTLFAIINYLSPHSAPLPGTRSPQSFFDTDELARLYTFMVSGSKAMLR